MILQNAFHHKELFRSHEHPVFLKQVGHDDDIGYSSLILQTEKDETFSGARTLAGDNASSNTEIFAIGNGGEIAGLADSNRVHPHAVIGHGVRANGQAGTAEVGHQPLLRVHGTKRGAKVRPGKFIKQRSRVTY